MKTTLMDCPKCGYFLDVKIYDHYLSCQYCRARLFYDSKKDVLIPQENQPEKHDNTTSGRLCVQPCTQCGALTPVENPEKPHSLFCNQCGAPLYWEPPQYVIDNEAERRRFAHERKMHYLKKNLEQQRFRNKLQMEQQRHNNKMELEQQRYNNKIRNKKANTEKEENGDNVLITIIGFVIVCVLLFGMMFYLEHKGSEEIEIAKNDPNIIFAPYDYSYFVNKPVSEGQKIFSDSGFININISETDEIPLIYTSKNVIDYITFNGKKQFDTGDYANKDAPIIIYYYPITIKSPVNSKNLKNKTRDEVIAIFRNAGFTNVTSVEMPGGGGLFKKKHLIDHVLFGSKSQFTTDDFIRKSDPIVVYYFEN